MINLKILDIPIQHKLGCWYCGCRNEVNKQMKNLKIRDKARIENVPLWKIAHELGITDSTFSKKLRFELSEDETQKILTIIDKLAKEGK